MPLNSRLREMFLIGPQQILSSYVCKNATAEWISACGSRSSQSLMASSRLSSDWSATLMRSSDWLGLMYPLLKPSPYVPLMPCSKRARTSLSTSAASGSDIMSRPELLPCDSKSPGAPAPPSRVDPALVEGAVPNPIAPGLPPPALPWLPCGWSPESRCRRCFRKSGSSMEVASMALIFSTVLQSGSPTRASCFKWEQCLSAYSSISLMLWRRNSCCTGLAFRMPSQTSNSRVVLPLMSSERMTTTEVNSRTS
mmetsp:Transcript_32476/g.81984  ORF Transcript_32476/g.81984 Transcript_32476/m.81984 type:complete len:253 (+) Transcript_32476:2389-3147(+)